MENPFIAEHTLFNERFTLITEDNEFRMSHWVKGFGIIDNEIGKYILDLNTSFHLVKFEEQGQVIKISFKVYPEGSAIYQAEIDPFKQEFLFNGTTGKLGEFWDTFADK